MLNYIHDSLVRKCSLKVQGDVTGDEGTSIQGADAREWTRGVLTDFTGGLLQTAAHWQGADEDEEAEIFIHFAHQAELKGTRERNHCF